MFNLYLTQLTLFRVKLQPRRRNARLGFSQNGPRVPSKRVMLDRPWMTHGTYTMGRFSLSLSTWVQFDFPGSVPQPSFEASRFGSMIWRRLPNRFIHWCVSAPEWDPLPPDIAWSLPIIERGGGCAGFWGWLGRIFGRCTDERGVERTTRYLDHIVDHTLSPFNLALSRTS